MKVVVSADLHLSSKMIQGRPRLPVSMQLMADLIKLCQINGAKYLFLLGDVLDQKMPIPYDVVCDLYKFFLTVKNSTQIKIVWLRGNHETPYKTDPLKSVITLFSEVVHVVNTEEVIEIDRNFFYCLPWFPENAFIKKAQDFAVMAHADRAKRKFLFTHVGLKEGRVSASNIQIPQRVGVSHLHPEMYDLVLLGDYHAHQAVGDNVFYLGAPIPHCYGDTDIMGPWLLDTDAMEMDPLVLPTRPPQFSRWTVLDDGCLVLPGYRPDDYNRIEAAPRLVESVRIRYPDADLRVLDAGEAEPDLGGSRLSASDVSDPSRLLERYIEYVRVKEEDKVRLKGIGATLLTEATRQ